VSITNLLNDSKAMKKFIPNKKQSDLLLSNAVTERFKEAFPYEPKDNHTTFWFVAEIYDYKGAEPIVGFRIDVSDAHDEYFKSCGNSCVRLTLMGCIRWYPDGERVVLQISQKNEVTMYDMNNVYVSV